MDSDTFALHDPDDVFCDVDLARGALPAGAAERSVAGAAEAPGGVPPAAEDGTASAKEAPHPPSVVAAASDQSMLYSQVPETCPRCPGCHQTILFPTLLHPGS